MNYSQLRDDIPQITPHNYFFDLFEKTNTNGGKKSMKPNHPNEIKIGINKKEIPEIIVNIDRFFNP